MKKKVNLSDTLCSISNKSVIRCIAISTLIAVLILGMSACGSPGNPSSPQNPPKTLVELSGTIDIGSDGDVTIGMELTANYTGPEGVAYQWKKSGTKVGANTKIFIPSAAGSYTVTVSAEGFKNKTSSAVTVKAEPTPGLAFTLDSITKTYSVSKGTITDYTVIIPDKYKGLPVTAIADGGFADYSTMTFIGIPDSVTSIGDNAFSGCTGLTFVSIPGSVKNIGSNAFAGCTSLTSIAIPFVGQNGSANPYFGYLFGAATYSDQNKSIPPSLKTVTITGGTSIADNAFSGCAGLTSVTIPGSVKSIGSNAFLGCTGLTSITIPAKVESIGSGAFSGCKTLASISIPFVGQDGTANSYFGYIFGASNATDQASSIPASLKAVTITGGTSIEKFAFKECAGLANITIPSSVTQIAQGAFFGCTGLTSITIPFVGQYSDGSGVTFFGHIFGIAVETSVSDTLKKVIVTGGKTIAGNAFTKWNMITDIILPDSVTSIVTKAFSDCISLESITIPTGLKSIGASTFDKCGKLAKVYYRGDASVWNTPTLPVGGTNGGLNTATIYSYSETDPGTGGKYWRFVDGVPAIW